MSNIIILIVPFINKWCPFLQKKIFLFFFFAIKLDKYYYIW